MDIVLFSLENYNSRPKKIYTLLCAKCSRNIARAAAREELSTVEIECSQQYISACVFVFEYFHSYFVNCICVFGFVYLAVCAPSEKLSAVEIEFSEHGQAQLPVSQMISLNGIWKQLNWRRFILDLVRQSHISKQQVDYFTEIRCNSFHKIQYQYQKLLLCSKMKLL